MLKKLFAAALLLAFTATANATPMKGIDGKFSIGGFATTTLSEDNTITEVAFTLAFAGGASGDFLGYIPTGSDVVTLDPSDYTNPLTITKNLVDGTFETTFGFTVGGFTFVADEVISNTTSVNSGSLVTNLDGNLHLRGTLSGNGFADTYTQLLFSTQSLNSDGTAFSGFSLSVTSPAPSVVSEPGTLAIFGLALVGFAAASRKKKSA
jgi:hypothetical protein